MKTLKEITKEALEIEKDIELKNAQEQVNAVMEHCRNAAAKGVYSTTYTKDISPLAKKLLKDLEEGIIIKDNGDGVCNNWYISWEPK